MSAVTDKFERDIGDTAEAIRECRQLASGIANHSDSLRCAVDQLDQQLRVITDRNLFAADPKLTRELTGLFRRIERLRELHNAAEHGAFSLQINRVAQAAWEALP